MQEQQFTVCEEDGGGAPGAEAEILLQSMVKASLQHMEVHWQSPGSGSVVRGAYPEAGFLQGFMILQGTCTEAVCF